MNTNIDMMHVRLAQPVPHWRQAVPHIFRLRLTASERKLLLAIGDLTLLNSGLLAVTLMWLDFQLTVPFLLAYAKWFVTLSVVWWGFSIIFDIYDLALSASTTHILRNAGLTALLTTGVYLLIPW